MARPRTATNILELKGAFKHDPSRLEARKDEPVPEGDIGEPPERMSDLAKECWGEIVGLCHRGTLCKADRLVVEHGSNLLAQLIAAEWIVHPSILIRFEAVLGKLGLSPADRSKVRQKLEAPKNPFSAL